MRYTTLALTEKENSERHNEAYLRTGFWGSRAAGALFLAQDTRRFMFSLRGPNVKEPNVFSTWGGAIDDGESPERAVKREIKEESGYYGKMQLVPLVVFRHSSGFRYYNYLAIIGEEFRPTLDHETQGYKWVRFGSWPRPLHPGSRFLLQHSINTILDVYNKI